MPAFSNAPQDKLLRELDAAITAGHISVCLDAEKYFDEISKRYPVGGSKIDWSGVPDSIHRGMAYGDEQEYQSSVYGFLETVVNEASLVPSDKLVVIGDGALDVALVLSVDLLRKYILGITDMPQHTYVLPPDVSWCACFSLEGWMDFGFSPFPTTPTTD